MGRQERYIQAFIASAADRISFPSSGARPGNPGAVHKEKNHRTENDQEKTV
jgi:hypothetical protein